MSLERFFVALAAQSLEKAQRRKSRLLAKNPKGCNCEQKRFTGIFVSWHSKSNFSLHSKWDILFFFLFVAQVVEGVVFMNKPENDRVPYYEILEKIYNVELHHFKRAPDELWKLRVSFDVFCSDDPENADTGFTNPCGLRNLCCANTLAAGFKYRKFDVSLVMLWAFDSVLLCAFDQTSNRPVLFKKKSKSGNDKLFSLSENFMRYWNFHKWILWICFVVNNLKDLALSLDSHYSLFLIQVVANALRMLEAEKQTYYETLESLYDVKLHHFKIPKDEL